MELNIDQQRIVDSRPNGQSLIKGVAGSGKTTVAVYKICNLIHQYMTEKDRILLVTYNKTLINYTKYIMKNMDIQQNLFFSFDQEKQLHVKTIDSVISYYADRYLPKRNIASRLKVQSLILKAIHYVRAKYPDLEMMSDKNYEFLKEEVDWLKSCRYIERETYLSVERTGRMSVGKNTFRLQKNSKSRNAIFDLYLQYEKLLEQEGLTDYKTNALNILEGMRNQIIKPEKYKYVIVDESQDLTRVQLEIIKYLYDEAEQNASAMFIADAAQSIYSQSWLSFQTFKSIGFDMSGRSSILSKNYRTTYEIAQAAYSLIENDDTILQNDIFVKPAAVERHGDMPYYHPYKDLEEEAAAIAERIKKLSARYSLKDIVITAARKNYLEQIQKILIAKGISSEVFKKTEIDFEEEIVRLYTLHSIKGLEFPVLFIAGLNQGILPYSEEQKSIGRRLLYVGMTRAKNELYLSSSGNPSVYVDEIDEKWIRTSDTEFSNFYRVGVEAYRWKERIQDLYSREEAVRQWMIQEIITKLDYPEEMIEIEYPVQSFSRKGYADIAVHHWNQDEKEPYILIETKQPGEDMERAMKELKSYISCTPTVRFAVTTDGFHTCIEKIQGKRYVPVQVLPAYEKKNQNRYWKYEYENLKNRCSYDYRINREDGNEIQIKQKGYEEVLESKKYYEVPIIGTVAAGALKPAYQEYMGRMNLPEEFGIEAEENFALKVDGDSMIDFDIRPGDYVVIKKQNFGRMGDIVVAGKKTEDEVTLKKYYSSGNSVILVPGNSSYESIVLPAEETYVNGIVVGIMKKSED